MKLFQSKKAKKILNSHRYCVIILNDNNDNFLSFKFFSYEKDAGNYVIKNDLTEKALIYTLGKIRMEIVGNYYS